MNVSHSHLKTKRKWKPNIQRVRAIVDGEIKRVNVCTRCLRSGKIQRAIWFEDKKTSQTEKLRSFLISRMSVKNFLTVDNLNDKLRIVVESCPSGLRSTTGNRVLRW